jgi:hypothetical protein
MTNTPPPSAGLPNLPRYRIGYSCDEWGARSSTPGLIPDADGPIVRFSDALAAIQKSQDHLAACATCRVPKRVTIADARDYLNINDKAFWVTGWNECVESMTAAPTGEGA